MFALAASSGLGAELEAAALRAALSRRAALPPNCFLSVNVSPAVLADDRIQAALREQGDLSGVAIELTERERIDSYERIRPYLLAIRRSGGVIAVDDTGSGFAGLSHLLNLRPEIIKLDHQLVSYIDQDEAKRALVETIGLFGSRIDAWLLAEGVERSEELDALIQLQVPLAQGYYLGRPSPGWSSLDPVAGEHMQRRFRWAHPGAVAELVEPVPCARTLRDAARQLAADAHLDAVVLVNRLMRPIGMADPSSIALDVAAPVLVAGLHEAPGELLRRAMIRDRWERFLPVACTDELGRYVGAIRIERLIEAVTAPT